MARQEPALAAEKIQEITSCLSRVADEWARMSLIIQKYGGSSVADAAGIKRVARRVVATQQAGNEVVVVVSAMGDTTDELLDLAAEVAQQPPARELDMLMTAGERISMALLAMAISSQGAVAQSFTGSQAGMITDGIHGKARIIDVDPHRVRTALDKGNIAIVAGFQGMSRQTNEITTMGRGGSDTTAVALAAALEADVCEIYTDVDGVYTADPRVVPSAQKINTISSEEMLEMAASGAKILHLRSVEYARRFGLPIHVRSSFSDHEGTWVMPSPDDKIKISEGVALEQPIISGVAHDRSEGKVTVVGVPDIPGKAAEIFGIIAGAHSNIDMIVQNISTHGSGKTDISFTLPMVEGAEALSALRASQPSVGFESLIYDDKIGKLSLIGAGMRSHPGVSFKFFKALSDAGINIDLISTSEIRISVVTRADLLDKAVRAVHRAFDLDGEDQATVYGGTGR
jgi:aspartate kinase